MRVLFSSFAVPGHLIPMLPLVRALRAAGDEVAFVGPPSIGHVLGGEDVQILVAGPEVMPDMLEEIIRRTGVDPRDGAIDVETEAEVFAGVRVDMSYDDVLAAARQWRPDLVVGDSYDYLGPLVAAALDVPFGTVTLGQDPRPEQLAALGARIAPRREERGLPQRRAAFVVDICPPALQADGWQKPEGWLPIRPEAYHAPGAAAPADPAAKAARPKVLLTFGTIFGDPRVVSPLVNAIAELDVDLHVTTGPVAQPEDFDVDRDRVRFEPFRPLADLLRDVDVVVCHAGAGTTYGALSAGIPLVVLPQGADQFAVADRAVAAGAALRLLPEETTPERLRQAVTSVLTDSTCRDNAAKVAAQIADMPTAAEVAESIAMLLR